MNIRSINEAYSGLFPFQLRFIIANNSRCIFQRLLKRHKRYEERIEGKEPELKDLKDTLKGIESVDKINPSKKIRIEKKIERTSRELNKLKSYLGSSDLIEFIERTKVISNAEPRTYSHILKKNKNAFHRSKSLPEPDDEEDEINWKLVEKRSNAFFFPNEMWTETMMNIYTFTEYAVFKEGVTGHLLPKTLNFLFVDIDSFTDETRQKLEGLKYPPDVVVKSGGKNRLHLYWSFNPISLPDTDSDEGSNELLKQYNLTQRCICKYLGGDSSKAHATALLRVPGTFNYKPNKNRRPKKAVYQKGSRTLAEAKENPKYNQKDIFSYFQGLVNKDQIALVDDPKKEVDEPPIIAVGEQNTKKTKPPFDFEKGWEKALNNYKKYFKLGEDYLTANDIAVFRYIWGNRYRAIINFQEEFRESLTGSGNKYSILNSSIEKIGRAGRGQRCTPIIRLEKGYVWNAANKKNNRLNGYVLDYEFLRSCGKKGYKEFHNSKEKVQRTIMEEKNLYKEGERHTGQLLDILWMVKTKFTDDEIISIIKEKTLLSSKKPNGCENSTVELESYLIKYVRGIV